MAYSITPSADDCYPGTGVLINKLNIRDQKQLDENEALITSVKTLQIELQPMASEPDFAYLKDLHRCLFEELYDSINYLHPFREGNGRVQRLYFRQLACWIGHNLNFAAVDSDRMMIATIRASAGVMDDLRQVFEEILK